MEFFFLSASALRCGMRDLSVAALGLLSCYYLFLAALGPRCCAWAFSNCGKQGLLFVVVASLVVEHGL